MVDDLKGDSDILQRDSIEDGTIKVQPPATIPDKIDEKTSQQDQPAPVKAKEPVIVASDPIADDLIDSIKLELLNEKTLDELVTDYGMETEFEYVDMGEEGRFIPLPAVSELMQNALLDLHEAQDKLDWFNQHQMLII